MRVWTKNVSLTIFFQLLRERDVIDNIDYTVNNKLLICCK